MEAWRLIQILETSVERNGEIPLTNRHLLNIIKMLERHEGQEEYLDGSPEWWKS